MTTRALPLSGGTFARIGESPDHPAVRSAAHDCRCLPRAVADPVITTIGRMAPTVASGSRVAVNTFRRPERRAPPPMVIERVAVRPPPELPERRPSAAPFWLILLPALGALGAIALIFTAGGSGIALAAGILFALSALA